MEIVIVIVLLFKYSKVSSIVGKEDQNKSATGHNFEVREPESRHYSIEIDRYYPANSNPKMFQVRSPLEHCVYCGYLNRFLFDTIKKNQLSSRGRHFCYVDRAQILRPSLNPQSGSHTIQEFMNFFRLPGHINSIHFG